MKLGKLEDPEFVIKDALVVTYYPGASPHQVELQVTDKIETAVRQLPNIQYVESVSKAGYSEVKVSFEEFLSQKEVEQYWDNLRRKVNDAQKTLPNGVIPSIVLDDYGDVYGMFLGITSDGYSDKELNNYVNYMKREFQNVKGISKVSIYGKKPEGIEIVVDRDKLANLNLNDKLVLAALNYQNNIVNGGTINHGDTGLRINIDESFQNIEDLENLIIFSREDVDGKPEIIYLKDIAKINRAQQTPISTSMRFNGKNAVGLMLAPEAGTNVQDTGKEVDKVIERIKGTVPAGINIEKIYYQPDLVTAALKGFVTNLVISVIVVVGVLLVFMGLRSGIIIGSGLILSILGTLAIMLPLNIDMQRVSLGAFIIAMGMLVDNSIVVADGILNALDAGEERFKAMTEPAQKTEIPLLGATLIAIMAFIPLYFMTTNAGEYVRSFFFVVAISLLLSWILALTQTPVYCDLYLKPTIKKAAKEERTERFYKKFKALLEKIIDKKWISLGVLGVAFAISMMIFVKLPMTFFPDSDKKGFVVNIWLPEGTKIDATTKVAEKIEEKLLEEKNVHHVTAAIGGSPSRYYIATIPEMPNSSFAQLIVSVENLSDLDEVGNKISRYALENYPEAQVSVRKYPNGIPSHYPVEVRFSGPDPAVLRKLAHQAEDILRLSPNSLNVKNNWRNPVLTWAPQYSQVSGRKTQISPTTIGQSIMRAGDGLTIGAFREEDEILPIFLREKEGGQNLEISDIGQLPVWGDGKMESIPLSGVIKSEELVWEDPQVWRRDGVRAITVQSDLQPGITAAQLREEIEEAMEQIKLPAGYKMEWAGEFYEQTKNVKAVLDYIPLQAILMFSICVILFNSIREPIVVFGILPMAFIGIAPGLYVMGRSFGFMSIIGAISLSGMMIKNGIVLLDEINYQIDVKKRDAYEAIIDSAATRIRPVGLAAVTTVFGMLPLVTDPLFGDMAVTIVFGLTVATVLTLFGVPLFYVVAYNVKK
jgi:multidrug efflux pump subunit AcrB